MLRLRPLKILLAFSLVGAGASAQALFEDDFESGLGLWTVTADRWHVELETDPCGAQLRPFPSGSACARYGLPDQCSHGLLDKSAGAVVSPSIDIPASDGLRRPELHYRYRYDVDDPDEGYDCADIRVAGLRLTGFCSEGGPTTYPETTTWGVIRHDLSAWEGQTVDVRFEFAHDLFYSQGAGFLVDDVWVGLVAGDSFCDSGGQPCCGGTVYSASYDRGGCPNSRGRRAELFGDGLPSLGADGLALNVSGMPLSAVALLVQGSPNATSIPFGDGAWCLGPPIRRLLFQVAQDGRARFPAPGQQPLSVLGNASIAQTVAYQVYYRDASATFCTSDRFNTTNGLTLTWAP